MTTEPGNSLQMLKSKLKTGLMDGKGINRISHIPGTDNYEIECDNQDLYLIKIYPLSCSVVAPLTEIKKINRGSPDFRFNSVEYNIEKIIRKMVENTSMSKQDIIYRLEKDYSEVDIATVLKHSIGLYCDINNIVHYRNYVYPDIEFDIGV